MEHRILQQINGPKPTETSVQNIVRTETRSPAARLISKRLSHGDTREFTTGRSVAPQTHHTPRKHGRHRQQERSDQSLRADTWQPVSAQPARIMWTNVMEGKRQLHANKGLSSIKFQQFKMSSQFSQTEPWTFSRQCSEGYMSTGDILETKERMENSIPYISLNSCRDTHARSVHTHARRFHRHPLSPRDPELHLLLGDPRLLPAVPLVVVQTAAVPVEDVQVMDRHLKHTRQGRQNVSKHTGNVGINAIV